MAGVGAALWGRDTDPPAVPQRRIAHAAGATMPHGAPIMKGWRSARRRVGDATGLGISAVKAWRQSGLSLPVNPLTGVRLGRDLFVHGVSPGIGWAAGAARHPDSPAVIDTHGYHLTQREAEDLTRRATTALRERGLRSGVTAAVLGRNSAGFAVAIAAVARTGADLVYLNPGFSADQIADLCQRLGVGLVLADPDLRNQVPAGIPSADLAFPESWAAAGGAPFRIAPGGGRHIILTSGTTGRPKGADRSRTPLEATVSLLSALPYRELGVHVMAAPLFHSWGWLNHRIDGLLDSLEIMVPRPDAAAVLDAAARHRASLVITTPVVVSRLADAGPGDRDLSALRGVLVSGAPIPPDVTGAFRRRFGDVLYNLYGSTEVGYATVAGPQDLAEAPTTAGRPLPGVTVALLDPDGRPTAAGTPGDVWVGSSAAFDGYVDGGDKERSTEGLVATGDVGVFDDSGRLFIRGRSDDLIISGGENVHPTEVEEVLRRCPGVADVAAVGRPDDAFGQRVVCYVVPTADADAGTLADEVLAYAARSLAPYQRPRETYLIGELPRNETGKVLRRLL